MQASDRAHAAFHQGKSVRWALHLLAFFWLLTPWTHDAGPFAKFGAAMPLVASVALFARAGFYRVRSLPRTDRVLLFCVGAVSVIATLRSLSDVNALATLFGNPEIGAIPLFVPLVVFAATRTSFDHKFNRVLFVHGVLGASVVLVYAFATNFNVERSYNSAYKSGMYLMYGVPLLLIAGASTAKRFILLVCCMALFAVAAWLTSSRFGLAYSLVVFAIAILFVGAKRRYSLALRAVVGAACVIAAAASLGEPAMERLPSEFLVDTRTFLIEELDEDLQASDWLVGRGALGTYFSPYFLSAAKSGAEADSPERQVIEIGVLHLILKVGLLGLIPYVLLLIRAATARNVRDPRVQFASRAFFLLFLVELCLVNVVSFAPHHLLVWLLAGWCLSRRPSIS